MIEWLSKQKEGLVERLSSLPFHVEYQPQDQVDTASTIKLWVYTTKDKDVAVPAVFQWRRARGQLQNDAPEFRGSCFICQPSDVGCKVIAESLQSQHPGSTIVSFGPIRLHPMLRQIAEQALSVGQYTAVCEVVLNKQNSSKGKSKNNSRTDPRNNKSNSSSKGDSKEGLQKQFNQSIQGRQRKSTLNKSSKGMQNGSSFRSLNESVMAKECKVRVKEDVIKVSHTSSITQFKFTFDVAQPTFISDIHGRVRVQFHLRFHSEKKKFLDQLFEVDSQSQLELQFGSKEGADQFITVVKASNTRRQTASGVALMKMEDSEATLKLQPLLQIQQLYEDMGKMTQQDKRRQRELGMMREENNRLQQQMVRIITTYTTIIQNKIRQEALVSPRIKNSPAVIPFTLRKEVKPQFFEGESDQSSLLRLEQDLKTEVKRPGYSNELVVNDKSKDQRESKSYDNILEELFEEEKRVKTKSIQNAFNVQSRSGNQMQQSLLQFKERAPCVNKSAMQLGIHQFQVHSQLNESRLTVGNNRSAVELSLQKIIEQKIELQQKYVRLKRDFNDLKMSFEMKKERPHQKERQNNILNGKTLLHQSPKVFVSPPHSKQINFKGKQSPLYTPSKNQSPQMQQSFDQRVQYKRKIDIGITSSVEQPLTRLSNVEKMPQEEQSLDFPNFKELKQRINSIQHRHGESIEQSVHCNEIKAFNCVTQSPNNSHNQSKDNSNCLKKDNKSVVQIELKEVKQKLARREKQIEQLREEARTMQKGNEVFNRSQQLSAEMQSYAEEEAQALKAHNIYLQKEVQRLTSLLQLYKGENKELKQALTSKIQLQGL